MADSAAERKRRSRRHQSGDHSLCHSDRCDQVPAPAEPSRGQRLYEQLHAPLGPAQRVLLQEACRIADRLDRLDAQLDGREREWLTCSVGEDVTHVTVVVDRALAEARQQAGTLKQLVAELRQSSAKRPPGTASGQEPKAGGLGDLTARIAARRDSSAG